MSSKRVNWCHELYLAVVDCNPFLTGEICQEKSMKIWNKAKTDFPKKSELHSHIYKVIKELKVKANRQRVRSESLFMKVNFCNII